MKGHLHPLSILMNRAIEYFDQYGFETVYGPEITTEEDNFDLLNIPKDHPSRDAHDTFYLKDGRMLRTHTSSMQVPIMTKRQPPVRLIFPGRVYRNETTDPGHNTNFYQIEGLVIDKNVSMANLVATLEGLMRHLLKKEDLEFRIRPSYFPFVEPGIELDMRRHDGKWMEILGAGMVHPQVLKNMNLDPNEWQGFAFGVGQERLLSIVTGLPDIRTNLSGDYRYLGQF